ncbi:MAG: ferritin family protein [Clostridia bacterium]|nr:ferritin family protein [Clostridia bacterium]
MVVRNESQALCVAVEMERRAIRVYERALMLADDPRVQEGIRDILMDEKAHLQRFSEMKSSHQMDAAEEQMLIASMAAEVLFTGGVMEMKREKALTTLLGLYRYAAESEAGAVRTYTEFAEKCGDPDVRETFLSIVREESAHLSALRARVALMEAQ